MLSANFDYQIIDSLIRQLSKEGPVIFLDSRFSDHPAAEFSYLAARPSSIIKAYGDTITEEDCEGNVLQKQILNPWKAFSDYLVRTNDWLFGYIGYDMKNYSENLTSENYDFINAPDLYFMVPSLLLKLDNKTGAVSVLKGALNEMPNPNNRRGEEELLRTIDPLHFESKISKSDYIKQIKAAQHRIKEGDFYEINLSRLIEAEFTDDPIDLYRNMCKGVPVPFGAFLSIENMAVCCLSPERFLCKKENRIISQPIKGTNRRSANLAEDIKLRDKLAQSTKDRAENLMIVDLVRNDLSKIARKESVRVSNLFEIQSFNTVHQMVSTIEADSDLEDPVQILKACFPMGSMTGAPKISAMKFIDKLENYKRGMYSGAIGYITPGYDFDFNVVIRTGIVSNDRLYYPVGGAITSDSVPDEEWEETIIKTKAITSIFQPLFE